MITKLKIDSNPFAKGFRDSTRLSDIEREGYASSSTLGEFSFLFGTDGGFKDLIPQSPISGDTIPLSLLSHHHHQPQNNPSGGGGGGGHALLPGCIGGVRPNARLKSGGDCLSRDAPYFSSSSSSPSSELTSSFNCRSNVFRRMLSLPQSIDYFYSVNNRTTDANKSSNFDDVSGKQMTSQRRRNKFYDLESSLFQSRDQAKETDIFNDSHIINSRRQSAHFVDSMLSTIPPPSSIRHLASRNGASLTPSTASDSFYALRYHPYLATSAILHSNRMPSEVFQM